MPSHDSSRRRAATSFRLITSTGVAVLVALGLSLALLTLWPRTTPTPHAPAPAASTTITVLAASSLTEPTKELAHLFEQQNPNSTITLVFAASNQLRTQLEHGAPGDLFLSADEAQIQAAAPLLIAASVKPFAHNSLALLVRDESTVRDFASLAAPGLRLVIADAAVPLGTYSLRMLDAAAASPLGEAFKTTVLASVRSRELNAKAVVAKVRLGEADVAIVYASDAAAIPGTRIVPIPTEFNPQTVYLMGVVSAGKQPAGAAAFADFLLSAPAQDIFVKHNLQPASVSTSTPAAPPATVPSPNDR